MDEEGWKTWLTPSGCTSPSATLGEKGRRGFELIAGEKMESGKAGGLIYGSGDSRRDRGKSKLEIALVENLQREDLPSLDLARGIKKLMEDFNLTPGRSGKEEWGKSALPLPICFVSLICLLQFRTFCRKENNFRSCQGPFEHESQERQEELVEEILTHSLSVRK